MKKRILSFLVACVMVVSTFIISKPLVHVHAEDETTYVEDENQWTLPMNWYNGVEHDTYTDSDGKTWDLASIKNGLWKLTSFSNPDDFSTMTWNGTKDRSWIESYDNRLQASGAGAVANNWGAWYLSARHRWNGGSIFARGDSSTWMKVAMTTVKSGTYQVDENGEYVLVDGNKVEKGINYVDSYSKNPAVVFTAPEAGTYSYSELVTANNLLDDSNLIDARNTAKRFAVNVTVRKEGVVINSFLLDEDNESNTLEGTVSLNKGERLAFVFSMITDNAKLGKDSTAETNRYALKLSDVVVKKIGEYPANGYAAKVDLTPIFEVGSYTDKLGNVTLMGCNITTKELYPIESSVTDNNHDYWMALDPLGKHGTSYSIYESNKGYNLLWAISKTTGLITAVGGAQLTTNTGSALVFEAPYDGIFSFDVTMTSCYPYAKNANTGVENFRYHDFTIAKEDGTILVTKHNEGATAKHASVTITAAAELKAGEKVIITKTPHANGSTQINASCNGNASISIYEVEHICSADTVNPVDANDANCVEGGNVAYYACSCGANYENADATGVIADVNTPVDENAHAPATEWTTDEVGHWYACDNGCGEKLNYAEHDYATGTCVCGKVCPHATYVDGKCADCGTDCPTHDMKNAEGKCANCGMTHEHAWMDGVCETCGYECQHIGGTATCANQAQCTACGSYYGDVDKTKHEQEGYWINNGDGTCYFYYPCCYAPTADPDEFEAALQPHEYDDDADMTCNHCGHDRTVEVKEEDFAGVFEDVYGEGESDVVAEAPEENAFDNYAAVAGSKVDVYLGFNLELVGANADYVYLRHHILYNGGEVLVDGNKVALNEVSGNYYYFDVAVAIGDFDKAHVVTIDGDTIVTASVYSYMKTAYGSGTLNAEQTNLLNALYQWDKAVADATYNG